MREVVDYVLTPGNLLLLLLTGFVWVMWRADGYR